MKDFQRMWYLALCVYARLHSDRLGHVPDNMRFLWEQSGCTAGFEFFTSNAGPVVACFVPTGDGWLRHDRVLRDVVSGETPDRKRTLFVDISSSPAFAIYMSYPRRTAKATAIPKIEKAIKNLKATKCVAYVDRNGNQMAEFITDEITAARFLTEAVVEYANSPAGQRGIYTPYPATWFHQQRYLDDRREWYVEESQRIQPKSISKADERIARIKQTTRQAADLLGLSGDDVEAGDGTGREDFLGAETE